MELTGPARVSAATDVTDAITNTAGAVAGFGLLALLRRGLGRRAHRIALRIAAVCTGLALLAAVAFALSPISFAQH